MYEADFGILLSSIDSIFKGICITFVICSVSSVLAFLIGSIIFFLRWCRVKSLNLLVAGAVEFIRNTPLLVQLYIFYKGLPQVGLFLPPLVCAILALSLYTGVYISETLRSGYSAVPAAQKNAAFALGFNDLQTFVYVIYPQTFRFSILPLGSQFINLVKNSTLASFIAITDLFYVVSQGISDYFRVLEFMVLGVALYGITTIVISCFSNFMHTKYQLNNRERA